MKQILIFGIFFIANLCTKADIVKTETLTRGEKTVYLLHDTHVSTPSAKLQAAAIDKALKETPDVKLLIQQVEPITESDKRLSDCLDDLNEIKLIVEGLDDEQFSPEMEKIKKTISQKGVNCAVLYWHYGLKKNDHSYGTAKFLNSTDNNKFYINHLNNWIRPSWRFTPNEEYLTETVKSISLKNMEPEKWQTLITNGSPEAFFYQYELWNDYLETLGELTRSKKGKEWIALRNIEVSKTKKYLKSTLRSDAEQKQKLNEIKAYEENSKFKFVYPKISDSFILPEDRTSSNHNDMLMLGINLGTEVTALSSMLNDKINEKKVIFLASNLACKEVKYLLELEGFSLTEFTGRDSESFRKIILDTASCLPMGFTMFDDFSYSLCAKNIYIQETELSRLSPELCTLFKN